MKALSDRYVGWSVVVALLAIVLVIAGGIVWYFKPAPHGSRSARRPVQPSAKDMRVTNRSAVDLWPRPDDRCVADEELAAAKEQGREPDLTYAHSDLSYLALPAGVHVQIVSYVRATCVTPQHDVMLAFVQVTDAKSNADGEVGYVTVAALSQERRAGSKHDRPVSGQARFRRRAAGTYR